MHSDVADFNELSGQYRCPLESHSGSQEGERFYSTNVAHGTSTNCLLIANQMSHSCFAIRGLKYG